MIRLSAADSGDCKLSGDKETNNSSRADGTIFFLWKKMPNSNQMYYVLACGE